MKAIHKEFWMEVRRSKARFISIFFIVALGVAFFSGIQASSPDMRFSGDAYFDHARLMDIKVMGTMGLTDDDVQAIKAVEGVEDAEGAYSTDVICGEGEAQKVLHVESVNEKMNQITPTEGRIPEKSGELFLDHSFAQNEGYKVGDSITLVQAEDSQLLVTEEYTIVGIGSSPLYISFNRGNTTLGSGEVNGFAYVMPADFDQEIYTQIYVEAHGARGLTSFTDAYDNLVEKIYSRVEGMEEVRCQVRYDQVVAEAKEELADARTELEDGRKKAKKELRKARKELKKGKKELEDGQKEYEDGKAQLEDAKKELADGRVQLEDGRRELADGKVQLEDGRRELEDGTRQIQEAQAELADGREQLNAAKKELSDGWAEVNVNQKTLDDGYKELNQGKKELEDAGDQIEAARTELASRQAELDNGRLQIEAGKEQIPAARADLEEKKQQCLAGLTQVEEGEAQIPAGEAALEEAKAQLAPAVQQLSDLQAQYEAALSQGTLSQEELSAMAAQVEALSQQVNVAQQELAAQEAQLNATKEQLAASRTELEGSLAQIEAGFTQLDQQEAQLKEQEEQLGPAQAQIDQGYAQLKEQEAKLEPARKKIEESEKTLAQGQAKLDKAKEELNAGQAEIDENEAVLAQGQAEIDANLEKLANARLEIEENERKLADAEKEIQENEKKLEDGEKEIQENEKKLADAKKELADGRKELKDGRKEYKEAKADAEKELADGEAEILDAEEEINKLKVPKWIVSDRSDLPEYSDYGGNADRIRNIGEVFPVIFFLVAALISLTTMTRMVEEQRTQIGTMKSLGYGKFAIASKYLSYAFLATVGGSILGVVIGEKILPYIIITAYGIMYHNMSSHLMIDYEWKFALMASVAAVVCTVGATVFSCYKALLETPASLMRPPSPKEGKRVLIERIGFIWKRLSFSWKSTLRNLFRYKKRFFMTIFGIAGSMGLMLVGFGLKDSIMDIATLQYSELQHYDGTIIIDEDADKKEKKELTQCLVGNDKILRYNKVQLTKLTAPGEKSNVSVYVYVPKNMENFQQDVTLKNRTTGEIYQLTDEGAAISEKTASLLGLKVGDHITITKDNRDYQVKVAVITENYMGHYVYMTPKVYRENFNEKPDFANIVFTVKEEYQEDLEKVGNEIMTYPAALSISYTSSLAGQLERMLSTLGSVILVLIISAGMLAFVVLYNLNNINITERKRELATLKVLGFYDGEVSRYVFRENILLTIIGVAVGAGFGILLHRYVITTVEVDAVMFGRNIKPLSFLYSGLFTCGFSLFVNGAMHFKLKKIDMVESLKSVE